METAAREQLVKVPLTNCSLAAVTGAVSIIMQIPVKLIVINRTDLNVGTKQNSF